jgi:tRNA threonylcarbamoyl adenosine modification protein YeaZ
LVLEGARRDAQWAVVHAGRIVGGRIKDRGAAERLAEAVRGGLETLGITPNALEHIIVGVGPGSYAGLRIVLSFAKGMAQALGCKIVSVPSMPAMLRDLDEAVLRGATALPAPRVALMNAFAGQVFAYGDNVPTDAYLPEALTPLLPANVTIIRDGDVPYAAERMFDLRTLDIDIPYGVLSLGLDAIARGEFADLLTLLPDYGRLSSAELKANLS